MKKTTITLTIIFGLGIALQSGAAEAQGTAGTATTKTPAGGGASTKGASAGSGSTTKSQGSATGARVTTLNDDKAKISYAIGMNLGNNFKNQGLDLDLSIVMQAVKDAMTGGKTLLTEEEAHATLVKMQSDLAAKQQEKMKAAGEVNLKEGKAFLEANKAKQGVTVLPSGLQYKILVAGTGPKPALADTVVCNYRGTLINGTEFDSSYKRGEPASFPVGRVIKGWIEALQLMPVGSKWQLFVPSELAYADHGAGPDIGPNAVLIFEVELISIKPKQ